MGSGIRRDNGERERAHGQMGDRRMTREFLIVSFRRTSRLMSFSVPLALAHLSNSDRQPRPRVPHRRQWPTAVLSQCLDFRQQLRFCSTDHASPTPASASDAFAPPSLALTWRGYPVFANRSHMDRSLIAESPSTPSTTSRPSRNLISQRKRSNDEELHSFSGHQRNLSSIVAMTLVQFQGERVPKVPTLVESRSPPVRPYPSAIYRLEHLRGLPEGTQLRHAEERFCRR